jgi:hypothetical protein
MGGNIVHVKKSALSNNALCGYAHPDIPGPGMAWTTFESARVMSNCAECLSEVLRDECSICDGSGVIPDYYEKMSCRACDVETAEDLIDLRRVAATKEDKR